MRTPRPVGGCHQCWTSPSTNCRAAARRRCSRARSRRGHRERHHVLQLVAESVGAAGLVERRPRPDPAAQRLIEQPAIEQQVHRPVRRPDLHRAQHAVPALHAPRARPRRGRPSGSARPAPARLRGSPPSPSRKTTSAPLAGAKLDGRLEDAARVEAGPDATGELPTPSERGGTLDPAVSPEELRPVPGPRGLRPAQVGEGDPAPDPASHALRAKSAPVSGSISVTTNGAAALRDGPRTHST